MVQNPFSDLWGDLLALGILAGFALLVYSRMSGKSVQDILREFRELRERGEL